VVKRIFWIGLVVVGVLVILVIIYPCSAMEVVVGAFISIWVTMLVEAIQKPDLEIELWQAGHPQKIPFGGRPGHVLHLQAVNKPLPRVVKWCPLQRSAATEASGTITFRGPEAKAVQDRSNMPVRWANSKQLERLIKVRRSNEDEFVGVQILDPERLSLTRSIMPGHREGEKDGVNDGVFSVALELEKDPSYYGVTNESYYYKWQPPGWKLALGKYLIDVKITASNASCEGVFRLILEGISSKDIRLSEATEEEKSKVRNQRKQEGQQSWAKA